MGDSKELLATSTRFPAATQIERGLPELQTLPALLLITFLVILCRCVCSSHCCSNKPRAVKMIVVLPSGAVVSMHGAGDPTEVGVEGWTVLNDMLARPP